MDRPDIFQTALSNFATDVACGGAIRHLTDIGYTLDQIVARLDYPTPREKARRIMMEHLFESRVLLREEPSPAVFAERTQFVQEWGAFGRQTLRKVSVDYDGQNKMTDMPESTTLSQPGKSAESQPFLWREVRYDSGWDGRLTELLHKKCEENGESGSYISCDFAFLNNDQNGQSTQKEEKSAVEETIDCLNSRQREYLRGIRWEKPLLYHRLDQRMREIVGKLYEMGSYSGVCYFIRTREKLLL